MTKTHTYPDNTLEKALRERGWIVQCNWQMKGPGNTDVAWMEHLVASDGKGTGFGTMIVQTFRDGGWNVYTDVTLRIDTDTTVDAVERALRRLTEEAA